MSEDSTGECSFQMDKAIILVRKMHIYFDTHGRGQRNNEMKIVYSYETAFTQRQHKMMISFSVLTVCKASVRLFALSIEASLTSASNILT